MTIRVIEILSSVIEYFARLGYYFAFQILHKHFKIEKLQYRSGNKKCALRTFHSFTNYIVIICVTRARVNLSGIQKHVRVLY